MTLARLALLSAVGAALAAPPPRDRRRARRLRRMASDAPKPARAYKAPRGTRDLLPADRPAWSRLERLAADLAARYGL